MNRTFVIKVGGSCWSYKDKTFPYSSEILSSDGLGLHREIYTKKHELINTPVLDSILNKISELNNETIGRDIYFLIFGGGVFGHPIVRHSLNTSKDKKLRRSDLSVINNLLRSYLLEEYVYKKFNTILSEKTHLEVLPGIIEDIDSTANTLFRKIIPGIYLTSAYIQEKHEPNGDESRIPVSSDTIFELISKEIYRQSNEEFYSITITKDGIMTKPPTGNIETDTKNKLTGIYTNDELYDKIELLGEVQDVTGGIKGKLNGIVNLVNDVNSVYVFTPQEFCKWNPNLKKYEGIQLVKNK